MGQIVGDVPSSPKDDDQHNDDGNGYDNPTVSSKTRDSLKEPHYARSKPSTETIVKRKPGYSSRNIPSKEGARSISVGSSGRVLKKVISSDACNKASNEQNPAEQKRGNRDEKKPDDTKSMTVEMRRQEPSLEHHVNRHVDTKEQNKNSSAIVFDVDEEEYIDRLNELFLEVNNTSWECFPCHHEGKFNHL